MAYSYEPVPGKINIPLIINTDYKLSTYLSILLNPYIDDLYWQNSPKTFYADTIFVINFTS